MIRSSKRFFYYLMEDPNSRAKQWFDVIITIVIVLSILSFLYEISEEDTVTFDIQKKYQEDFSEGSISTELREIFAKKAYGLSLSVVIETVRDGEWRLQDLGSNVFKTYTIVKRDKVLQVTCVEKQILFEKLHIIDFFVICIFILEYLLRFWLATDSRHDFLLGYNRNRRRSFTRRFMSGIGSVVGAKLAFMIQPMALIDLLAILPFLRPLRFLRMLRLLRLLKVVRYSRSMESLITVFRDRAFEFFVLLILIGLLLIFTSALIFMVEKNDPNSSLRTMPDAIWWSIVTLTTVGYGDVYPTTPLGRVVGAIVMIMGIGVLAIPSGILASALTEKLQEMKQGARNMKDLKEHMVICGWNEIAQGMVEELQGQGLFHGTIVVITNKENFNYANALYKRGDFAKESVLSEVNIAKAKYVIIVAEAIEGYSIESIDARTLLTTLLVEKLNSTAHIVVEVQNVENASLLKSHQARCEVVTSDEVTSTLLSSSIISPGVSSVVADLLSYEGNNIYKVAARELPLEKLANFSELISYFRKLEIPGIPIALEKGGEQLVNPPDSMKIDEEDQIFYISTESYFAQ